MSPKRVPEGLYSETFLPSLLSNSHDYGMKGCLEFLGTSLVGFKYARRMARHNLTSCLEAHTHTLALGYLVLWLGSVIIKSGRPKKGRV